MILELHVGNHVLKHITSHGVCAVYNQTKNHSPQITNITSDGNCSRYEQNLFSQIVLFCLKNEKWLEHKYLSLLVSPGPVIPLCLRPFPAPVYCMPEISLSFVNSSVNILFKFRTGSSCLTYSFN